MSRPTIMTPKTIDKLREAFMMGCSDREVCIYANIANQTLYNYQREHPEFLEQKITYKTNPLLKARKTIFDNLNEIKTAQWYMERKAKQEFCLESQMRSSSGSIEDTEGTYKPVDKIKDKEELKKDIATLFKFYDENGEPRKIKLTGQRIGMGGKVIDSGVGN